MKKIIIITALFTVIWQMNYGQAYFKTFGSSYVIANAGSKITVNGEIVNTGTITLKCNNDNQGAASLIYSGTVSGGGTYNYQRYLPAVTGNQHLVSSPIKENVNKSVLGTTAKHYNASILPPADPYVAIPTSTLALGKGYAVNETPKMITFTGGVFNSGVVPLPYFNAANRSELVGNPFPAFAIDWGYLTVPTGWTRTNITTSISIRNVSNMATYNSANGASTNGGTRYILGGQGFFIKTAFGQTSFSLSCDYNVCRHIGASPTNLTNNPSSPSFLKSMPVNTLRLLAENDQHQSDETLILFDASKSEGSDDFDTPKFFMSETEFVQIYTLSSNKEELAVNCTPEQKTIPLFFLCGVSGKYSIKATELQFDKFNTVYLEDLHSGGLTDLTRGGYAFKHDASSVSKRFLLHFTNNTTGISSKSIAAINIYGADRKIYINNPTSDLITVSVFDLTGKKLKLVENLGFGLNWIELNGPAGNYVVKAQSKLHSVVKKINLNIQ